MALATVLLSPRSIALTNGVALTVESGVSNNAIDSTGVHEHGVLRGGLGRMVVAVIVCAR